MQTPVPPPGRGVLSDQIDGNVTIYAPADRTVRVLDGPASTIWRAIDGRRSEAEVIEVVAVEYGTDTASIAFDVRGTIATFLDAGLLGQHPERQAETVTADFGIADNVIRLVVPDKSDAVSLLELLPRLTATAMVDATFVVSRGSASQLWHLALDRDRIVEDCSLNLIEKRLVIELNRLVRDRSGHFAVHAGAVAVNGMVLAFPGDSGRGKSTLVAACVKAGFAYVTDEALLLDYDTEEVHPYQKPIQLDTSSMRLLGLERPTSTRLEDDVLLSAESIGGHATSPGSSLWLGHVVVPVLAIGDSPQLGAEPRAHVVAALLNGSFNHYQQPDAAFDLACRLAARARAWELTMGDPHETAALLWKRFGPGATSKLLM
jgi:hypothetical protein